ncbi:hypothetical protein [Haloferula helveola]|uniref:hypothetical protein n=1 Tax=Haloferula helveola TaxID=490095 RepID=UPI0030D452C4
MSKDDDTADQHLRVIEEKVSSEEVLRLGKDEEPARSVARLPVAPAPEMPTRLAGADPDLERRSHEPDIDAILDEADTVVDPEEDWKTATRKPVPYGWFVLIVLFLAVAVVVSVAILSKPEERVTEISKKAATDRLEEEEAETAEAVRLVESAERLLAAYLRADTVEALLPLVRDRERVEPLIRNWYRDRGLVSREFASLRNFSPYVIDGRTFWRASSEVSSGSTSIPIVQLLLEEYPNGELKVDWETSVCYQPMDWDEYVLDRPEGDLMAFRVYLNPDIAGLYSHEYADESNWRGFNLTALDSDEYLVGYVERGSALEGELLDLWFENRRNPVALQLELLRPEGSLSPRGVRIETLLSKHWLVSGGSPTDRLNP